MRKDETKGKTTRRRKHPELNGSKIADVDLLRKKKEAQSRRVEERANPWLVYSIEKGYAGGAARSAQTDTLLRHLAKNECVQRQRALSFRIKDDRVDIQFSNLRV